MPSYDWHRKRDHHFDNHPYVETNGLVAAKAILKPAFISFSLEGLNRHDFNQDAIFDSKHKRCSMTFYQPNSDHYCNGLDEIEKTGV